jgi:hypothetical protein
LFENGRINATTFLWPTFVKIGAQKCMHGYGTNLATNSKVNKVQIFTDMRIQLSHIQEAEWPSPLSW